MLKRLITTSVLVVLVGAASGANAFTNTSDKRTYFTFSQPVALPGVTLPAGTYMFRLADDTTTRKVIQVTNKEGTQNFAMLHTMPVYRLDAPRDPEVRFMETASGAPIAVRAWWQGGERTGYEFIYSKAQLAALNRNVASAEPAPIAPSADAGIESEAPAGEPVPEGPLSGPDVVDGPGVPRRQRDGRHLAALAGGIRSPFSASSEISACPAGGPGPAAPSSLRSSATAWDS